jgi:hypothetical protein
MQSTFDFNLQKNYRLGYIKNPSYGSTNGVAIRGEYFNNTFYEKRLEIGELTNLF